MLLTSLMIVAEAAMTLHAFEALPPTEAGARALEGQEHGPIDKVERDLTPGAPPGTTEYLVYEKPLPVTGGCRRTKWKLSFSRRGSTDGPPTLSGAYRGSEVGLAKAGSCNAAAFVHLNPTVDQGEALLLLAEVDAIASDARDVEFACQSAINDELCRSPGNIREALRSLTPFAISPVGGTLELWLVKQRGGVVTKARFDPARHNTLVVQRAIPAPF